LNDPNFGKKYKITVTWDIVDGAEAYAIYVATQYYPEGMMMGTVTSNEFIMGSDADGELYVFVKTICDTELIIVSEYSEQIGVNLNEDIEDASAVKAPANLTATAKSTSSIELTWDAVGNASSYFVYRNDVEIANITGTTYVDENLAYDTEYCYTVTSVLEDQESEHTEVVCVKTLGESLTELESSFILFPNPANDRLYIKAEAEIMEVSVYDVYGRVQNLRISESQNLRISIDVANLKSGIYFVKVNTDEGNIVKRIIKD
jgi:fibronectin type 3 domain-containing protein